MQESRERAIGALQESFARDDLDVEEFERRVTAAHTVESPEEIDALTRDLEPLPVTQPALRGNTDALIPRDGVPPVQTIRGLMSATSRTGPWTVPRRLRIRTVMSSTVLDFREARFPSGAVELDLRAVMASVEIIVPPSLAVETRGSAFMGTFDEIDRAPSHPDPDAPLLRIHGLAVLGAVEVKMRLPGESDREHRQRQSREQRDTRRAERALERSGGHR
jgi:Cell wall-active antibiotics response 4TMS YvqF/Domain of unknown function (DUF1707)